MSNADDGPWSPLITGTLEQGASQVYSSKILDTSIMTNIQKYKEDLQEFHPYNEQIKHRTGRFLKLEIDSFYGAEAGLVYFAVNGKNSPTGDY